VRFPHPVTIIRPTGADEYGNAGASFDFTTETSAQGFEVVDGERLLLPASADVKVGDRVRVNGSTYAATPVEVRSPSRGRVLWDVALQEVHRGP
jgi:hypothetical protein